MRTIHTQIAKLKPRNAKFSSAKFSLYTRFELGPGPPVAFLLSSDYHSSQFSITPAHKSFLRKRDRASTVHHRLTGSRYTVVKLNMVKDLEFEQLHLTVEMSHTSTCHKTAHV